MLQRPSPHLAPQTGRRRWRMAQPPDSVPAALPAVWTRVAERPWALDEVGAAAVELGLFPESCLPDASAAGDRA